MSISIDFALCPQPQKSISSLQLLPLTDLTPPPSAFQTPSEITNVPTQLIFQSKLGAVWVET